jgi:hypothetical protein
MKETKKTTAPAASLFTKDNYIWMIAGIILVGIGIILMSGGKSDDPNVFRENEVYSVRRITIAPILGKSDDPNVFRENEVYSVRRITIAPILILLGLGIEVYAIFKKPKAS